MKRSSMRGMYAALWPLAWLGMAAAPAESEAQGKPAGEAAIVFSEAGPARFTLAGTAQHFGKYECMGEIDLQPGAVRGTWEGTGVAVLEAANGDRIVGVVNAQVDANGLGQIHFSWRDAVEFDDGTTAVNTGRFARQRPPGVVIAIIAILIG